MSAQSVPREARRPSPLEEFVRDDVLAMSAYHVPESAGLLKLDAMENPYELPAALRRGLGERLAAAALNRYPSPAYSALKDALRAKFGVPARAGVTVGNGSDEIIAMLSVITARPGATVVAPVPSFVMYEMSARFAGSRFVGVPLGPGFGLDVAAMLDAIRRERPALVYLAYPNNPTGNCFDDAAIEAVLAAAPGLVVVDEAYQPFAVDTWMGRLADHPNLLVMRTVSKLGLAGIRLGYCAAAPSWIEQVEKVRPPYNVNVLTEAAALFALEHLDEFDEQARRIRADRDALAASLARIPGVAVHPSRANFLLVRVPDGAAAWRSLREQGVLVKDVGRMHPSLANCLRLTVGTPEQNSVLAAALARALSARTGSDAP